MRSATMAVLAVGFLGPAAADDPLAGGDLNAEVPVEELRGWHTYTLEADGRYVHDLDRILLIRTEKGIRQVSQATLRYTESRETLEVLEAYTEAPDGHHIPVPPDKILTRESPVVSGAPMYADVKVISIIFPDVEVNSKLHYRARRTVKEPLFPGYFQIADFVGPHALRDDERISVYAAAGASFKSEVVGFQGGPVACPSDQAGRKCYTWSARNTTFVPNEPSAVSPADYGQHVIISNLPSYEAIGTAYWARAADKVAVTPKIQALADELTQGLTTPRDEAEALYNWVARNIRYVAISIGTGSVVPRPAGTVLDNRYGDCKDHVTLLQALLAAKHIDSVGVLVGVDNRWRVPATPEMLFDHIITYIPSLSLYADSTAQFARFGQLPEVYVGKMGLKTQPVQGAEAFAPIASQTSDGEASTSVDIQLAADGSASGTAEAHLGGSMELTLRHIFASLPPGQQDRIASALLAEVNESGAGSLMPGDPHDLTKPFVYRTKFTITNLVSLPGPGAFPVPSGLRILRVADLAQTATLETRRYPWVCGLPGDRKETVRLTLPDAIHLVGGPKDVHLQNDFGRYDAHYEQSGSVLTVTREFAHTWAGEPCDERKYQEFRAITQAIARDVKAQYLFQ
jgi:transglutaminase-like putative cysteine protease